MMPVVLKYSPVKTAVFLREISGRDELVVTDEGTRSAVNLLNGILGSREATALKAEKMATADRDRLLAALYQMLYGTKIESTIICQSCQERFELNFSLPELQEHLQSGSSEIVAEELQDGTYRLSSGCRFRLPTGEDELAVAGYPGEEAAGLLLEKCLLEGELPEHAEEVLQAMTRIAPLLQTEIEAVCPECGQAQQLRFDLQSFLLRRLQNERRQTSREIHQLAATYQWSHHEIVELPRSIRRMYVDFIDTEA